MVSQMERPNRPIPLTVHTQNSFHIKRKPFVNEKEGILIQNLIVIAKESSTYEKENTILVNSIT